MTSPAPQPAATCHCWKCNYPLPALTPSTSAPQQCPECGHRGHPVSIPRTAPNRRFALGAALMIAAVAILPILAAGVSALLRL